MPTTKYRTQMDMSTREMENSEEPFMRDARPVTKLCIEEGSFDDWFCIVRDLASDEEKRAAHMESVGIGHTVFRVPERLSNADCEGTRDEMREIALAIIARKSFRAKRCAVELVEHEGAQYFLFWSPRNSFDASRMPVTIEAAVALATEIVNTLVQLPLDLGD